MKLHLLEIQAFGPFADTSAVDFDTLSAAGLFLLSGATGSGKTSVLDAVCFALYGDVPGDRSSAKRLRADQAPTGLAPRVTLEATLSGRRFRFVRSPQWERPKKRGTGTTTEQASVVVSERMKGQWIALSTRLDEAGQLVTGLVGMTLTQFTQVAMLPQGRFQTFLRARSEDRHQLLQQLFRTGRFHDVERWLREHRLELRRTTTAAHQDLADLVSRISEATTTSLPESWDLHDLSGPLREAAVDSWVAERVHEAASAVGTTTARAASAAELESGARDRLDTAKDLLERRRRHQRAHAEHEALEATAPQHARAVARLEAARRAAPLVPLLRATTTAARESTAAEAASDAARALVVTAGDLEAGEDPGEDHLDLERVARELTDRAAHARALAPRERELDRVLGDLGRLDDQIRLATATTADLTTRSAELPAALEAAQSGVRLADDADRRLLTLQPQRERLAAQLAARREVRVVEQQLVGARAAHADAREATMTSRQALLDAREARLDSMAAEIAGVLAVGESCPVCGSCEHPSVAASRPGAVDAAAEDLAQRGLDDAQALELLRDVERRDLEHHLAVLLERAGESTEVTLATELADLDAELTATTVLAATSSRRRASLDQLGAESESLGRRLAEAAREAAGAASRRDALLATSHALRAELDETLEPTGHEQVADLVRDLEARLRTVGTATERRADARHRRRALDEATRSLEWHRCEAGFASLGEAESSVLAHDAIRALTSSVSDHDRRRAAADAVLAELAEVADDVLTTDPPDVQQLGRAHRDALAALGDARGGAARAGAVHDRLAALVTRLQAAVTLWTPLHEDLELATRVSSFAEGRSADNRLAMRLSAYVLAHRLSQVVAAANERLASMSDQRYSLEHTAQRGAGETRGGLSLLVRDDWSGESRDPATLSGGETFVVSLALALGLADVITQEAGGADLDTLFVDEGFGSLDADTLDDVMDTLDTLRDGGRVVGVVSHVAEMRDRIPTRLLVAKSRTGSTLSQVP